MINYLCNTDKITDAVFKKKFFSHFLKGGIDKKKNLLCVQKLPKINIDLGGGWAPVLAIEKFKKISYEFISQQNH